MIPLRFACRGRLHSAAMVQLGVNIDHVATVRQARRTFEPDPVQAAYEAQLGGADGITVHLREDRRHIGDEDVARLRELVTVRLNLEMAATPEMVAIAIRTRPDTVMLVPEGRNEVTTEGGLDVAGDPDRIRGVVDELRAADLRVSAFIDPDVKQVEAANAAGFSICEVHTGPYAHAFHRSGRHEAFGETATERKRVQEAGDAIQSAGMIFNAGHGLDYHNVDGIASLRHLHELHIGHGIVSRAIFVGLRDAVATMKTLIRDASMPRLHE